MVALSNFSDMTKTAIEEGLDIIFSGAGLPLNLSSFLKETKETKLVPIVTFARAAGLIAKEWLERYKYAPDAFAGENAYREDKIVSVKELVNSIADEYNSAAGT